MHSYPRRGLLPLSYIQSHCTLGSTGCPWRGQRLSFASEVVIRRVLSRTELVTRALEMCSDMAMRPASGVRALQTSDRPRKGYAAGIAYRPIRQLTIGYQYANSAPLTASDLSPLCRIAHRAFIVHTPADHVAKPVYGGRVVRGEQPVYVWAIGGLFVHCEVRGQSKSFTARYRVARGE